MDVSAVAAATISIEDDIKVGRLEKSRSTASLALTPGSQPETCGETAPSESTTSSEGVYDAILEILDELAPNTEPSRAQQMNRPNPFGVGPPKLG